MQHHFPRPGYQLVSKNPDRRASLRRDSSLETSCEVPYATPRDDDEVLVEVLDISCTGIGLILNRRLPLRATLSIRLSNGAHSASYPVRVIHAARLEGDLW